MNRKEVEKDPFDEYHKSALRQDLFGMAFAFLSVVVIFGGLILLIKAFPSQ
jgi:hypothetical protein